MVNLAHRERFLGPGDKLGKYELIRQIAVGSTAEIYLGRTRGIEGFEKLVVLKRILPQYRGNEQFVTTFLDEARLTATLHHPNIAQVFDIGQEVDETFYSMEYVHGEDLGRLLAAAAGLGFGIPLDAALTLVVGLCAGLNYAHAKVGTNGRPLDIVHRDVTPSNVVVSYDGSVKLVDFGVARAGRASRGNLKGELGYMSPEQCQGAHVDKRSDLYAIGAILYRITTGRMPFDADTEYGILNQIVNHDVPPPTSIVANYPRALETIVMRALSRDPDRRYRSAVELQSHVEDFAHENRIRISPLVLASLMSSLFPGHVEEWDRARGAVFVEQSADELSRVNSGDDAAAEVDAAFDMLLDEAPRPKPAPAKAPPPRASAPAAANVWLANDDDDNEDTVMSSMDTIIGGPLVDLGVDNDATVDNARRYQTPPAAVPIVERPSYPPTPAYAATPSAPSFPSYPSISYEEPPPTPSYPAMPSYQSMPAPAYDAPNQYAYPPAPEQMPVGQRTSLVTSPRSKKKPLVFALVGGVGVVGAVVAALVLSGGSGEANTKAEPAKVEDSKPALEAKAPTPPKPEAPKPEDVKPAEPKPADVKPEDVKPSDVKPEDVKPSDVKPEDVKPEDVKPEDVKPEDVVVKADDTKKPVKKPIKKPIKKPTGTKTEPRDDDSPFLPVRQE